MSIHKYLSKVVDKKHLSEEEAYECMQQVLSGQTSTAQLAALLVALRMKGESPSELVGFARAMQEHAVKIPLPPSSEPLLDTCGTGGDASGTFNVSTVSAFVVAGAGVRVAKHGNRSISSKCGSADLLEKLGVEIIQTPERVAEAILSLGIAFLFAPAFHPAMKHAQPARLELRMRTIFNMLGPLVNPAGTNVQLIGTFSLEAAEIIAQAAARLGLRRAVVVHSADGLDEISPAAETFVFDVRDGSVQQYVLTPEDFGLSRSPLSALRATHPDESVQMALRILHGEGGPIRDFVLMNSSAALVAAGKVTDWREGVEFAKASLESGAAWAKLQRLIEFSKASSEKPPAASQNTSA